VKSLASQSAAMKERWPEFISFRGPAPGSTTWLGGLDGLGRRFLVSIQYGLPMPGDSSLFRCMPVVRVHSPRLVPNFRLKKDGPLPHVYFKADDLPLSPLCLFDPAVAPWTGDELIAETTVYWAIHWLVCYEGWEATGEWFGGGRHPSSAGQANV